MIANILIIVIMSFTSNPIVILSLRDKLYYVACFLSSSATKTKAGTVIVKCY